MGSAGKTFEVTQVGPIIQVTCESAELAAKLLNVLKPLLERNALPAKKGAK